MKSPELCLYEIIQSVMKKKDAVAKDANKSNKNECALHMYSKMRNFDGCQYKYEGVVRLDKNLQLMYLFTNKRSCLSIKHMPCTDNYESLETLHKLVEEYTERLMSAYSLDEFIAAVTNKQLKVSKLK